MKLSYTNSTTAHTLSFLKHYAKTTLSSAAAAGQAVVNITADAAASLTPGAIAAGDVLVIQKPDGTWHTGQVSSVSTLAITLTANVPTGGFNSGATVFFMGAAADVVGTGDFALAASATTALSDTEAGVYSGNEDGPLVVESNNATAAGTLDFLNAVWIP